MLKIVNTNDLPESYQESPLGKFGSGDRSVSVALRRQPFSTDLHERHPFDVEIRRVPAGKSMCPYHSHSAQWEFYHVIAGHGRVRHAGGTDPIKAGDAFFFPPGEPHQLFGGDDSDLTLYIVADNPVGESCHYPDSGKFLVRVPERRLMRGESLDYFDGEE